MSTADEKEHERQAVRTVLWAVVVGRASTMAGKELPGYQVLDVAGLCFLGRSRCCVHTGERSDFATFPLDFLCIRRV